jgi:CYTH domain-containing protein
VQFGQAATLAWEPMVERRDLSRPLPISFRLVIKNFKPQQQDSFINTSRQRKHREARALCPSSRIRLFDNRKGLRSLERRFCLVENRLVPPEHKYARIEWERRFLLDRFPGQAIVTRVRRIEDRYIEGTTLRLRQQTDDDGQIVFKLTQKLRDKSAGARQGLITTMYLAATEFGALAKLPAKVLTKSRHSVPPFGIDVFDGVLSGLILAEAEFHSAVEVAALALPSFIGPEVSDDPRFTGGRLVAVSREELKDWLAQYGIELKCKAD